MSTSVKYITSEQRGSPTINGTAGTLIAALDALFTTGRGVTTALGITVSGGIATAALTSGQSFDRDAVVLVEGATPGALNGEARVLSTGAAFITWATSAPDGVATGTITIKYAPQTSWEKVFSATNKAVYRSTDVTGNRHHLRVDDTGTTAARVRGFETMTDVDTGTGPFPTNAQIPGGGYWWKNTFTAASPVRWMMFSDERFLLLAIATGTNLGATYSAASLRGFGDPIVLAPGGDAWASTLSFSGSDSGNFFDGCLDSGTQASGISGGCAMPRAFSGLGGSVLADTRSESGTESRVSGVDPWMGPAPSSVDGQIKTSRRFLKQPGAGASPRAVIPGVYYIPQSGLVSIAAHGDILDGSGPLAGRKLMAIFTAVAGNTLPTGVYLVDLTGPWR